MFIVPKNGATVTIFSPYDCNNSCPFCINKKDYAANPEFDMDKVVASMVRMHNITPNCDFVITGGEPLADLNKFDVLVSTTRTLNSGNTKHKLFVNTTFPTEDVDRLNKYKDVITGFNISRHLKKYVKEVPDEVLAKLEIPVRINCVLYTTEEIDLADNLINRFKDMKYVQGFQFRDDYTKVTLDNLDNVETNEKLSALLKKFGKNALDCIYHYQSFRWDCQIENSPLIKFHRTLPFSKIMRDNGDIEINDVIIDPRGNIFDDWNNYGKELNLEEYNRGVNGKAIKLEKLMNKVYNDADAYLDYFETYRFQDSYTDSLVKHLIDIVKQIEETIKED